MTEVYAIYGASGCGRSLMPVAREHLARQNITAQIYFIDDSLTHHTIFINNIYLNILYLLFYNFIFCSSIL